MATPAPKPTTTPTPAGNSAFAQALAGLTGSGSNPYAIPTTTKTTYLTQTSAPDLASTINGLFQSLVGRYATPEEIQKYGQELLAAEKANPGTYSGETTYQQSGKRATVSGTQLTAGVNEQAFLTNLIQGTASAKEYKAGTQYLNAITSINDKFRGGYSG